MAMVDQRLGPRRRIKRRQDFLRIQAEGRKHRSRHLLISVSRRARSSGGGQHSESRIGVTITKKVDKRAARRNRLRRRIREIFRRRRGGFSRAADIVVIALSGSAELGFSDLEQEFWYLLKKAGLAPVQHSNRGRSEAGTR